MRAKAIALGCLTAGIVALGGCYHEKFHVKVKHPEDYVIPPNDARYDQPPEADYKPPMKIKDNKNMGMPSSGMGGGGPGAYSGNGR